MIFAVGEILIDHFPDYHQAGGAPFNFAYHLKKLGLPVRLISRIGDDADGCLIQRLLGRHGFNMDDLQIDPCYHTGAVNVTLDDAGVPTFEILQNVAYDHLQLNFLSETGVATAPTLIYYGSLIQRTTNGLHQVGKLFRSTGAATKCFCDINLRPPHYSLASVEQSLRYADILKLNDQEFEDIRKLLGNPVPAGAFADYLLSHFKIEILAITRGAAGSTLTTVHQRIDTPPSQLTEIVDTVGAGDGFAAILALGVQQAWPLATIARTANEFAADICQNPGAVVTDEVFYCDWKLKLGGTSWPNPASPTSKCSAFTD